MRLLLDTHVLLWWLDTPARLASEAREAISDSRNEVYISAVVALEITIKSALGKLDEPDDLHEALEENGFRALDITIAHALALADLPPYHRDPFDRLLVAQARCERLILVSHDAQVARYPVAQIRA